MPWAPLTLRRNVAYEKLGIDRKLVSAQPPITAQLRLAARIWRRRKMPETPYYYLRCSELPEARKLADLYYSLPKNQRDIPPIEAYCLAISIPTATILDNILQTSKRVSLQISGLNAAVSHPDVTESTIDLALNAAADSDKLSAQTLLHKAVGFLPSPRGAQTTVNVAANASAEASPQQHVAVLAPPPEQTIRRLVDRFNDARGTTLPVQSALPEAPPTDLPARMPYEEDVRVAVEVDADADDSTNDADDSDV